MHLQLILSFLGMSGQFKRKCGPKFGFRILDIEEQFNLNGSILVIPVPIMVRSMMKLISF